MAILYVESTIVASAIFVTEAMHFAMVAAVRAGPPDLGQYLRGNSQSHLEFRD